MLVAMFVLSLQEFTQCYHIAELGKMISLTEENIFKFLKDRLSIPSLLRKKIGEDT